MQYNNENIRLTKTTMAVLEALLAASPQRPVWGAAIANDADMEPSSVSQILTRLRERGWTEAWQEERGSYFGRPRTFHELTPDGHRKAVRALLERQTRRAKQGFDTVPR